MSDFGFRRHGSHVFESKYCLPSDKILDEKTYRLRLIMRAAASLITGAAYFARVLPPVAVSYLCSYPVVGNSLSHFPGFTIYSVLALFACLKNTWWANDIANSHRQSFFQKPELVRADDAFFTSVRGNDRGHDLLFDGLRSCFVCSRENIWFQSLAIEATSASPVVKTWRALHAGINLGLRHNALRSFRVPSPPDEQIVFRLDNAGCRSPIRELDFYGCMAVQESDFQENGAWTFPDYSSGTPSHSRRHRRHSHVAGIMGALSRAAALLFSRRVLRRLATPRRKSVSAGHRPVQQI